MFLMGYRAWELVVESHAPIGIERPPLNTANIPGVRASYIKIVTPPPLQSAGGLSTIVSHLAARTSMSKDTVNP